MAGDNVSKRVVGESITDGTGGCGRIKLFCQPLIGGKPPWRKTKKGFPDFDLEVGATQVDMQGRRGIARKKDPLHDRSSLVLRFA